MVRIAVLVVVLAAACTTTTTADESTVTTSPVTTSPVTTSPVTTSPVTTTPLVIPEPLSGFSTTTIVVGDTELTVAVAATAEERRQGLMNVTDLGSLDGMLFAFDAETAGSFWMLDTPLALDIAFFDDEGSYVDHLTMEPCPEEPCERYAAGSAYLYAVEVPAGGFAALTGSEQLVFVE